MRFIKAGDQQKTRGVRRDQGRDQTDQPGARAARGGSAISRNQRSGGCGDGEGQRHQLSAHFGGKGEIDACKQRDEGSHADGGARNRNPLALAHSDERTRPEKEPGFEQSVGYDVPERGGIGAPS